MRYKDPMHWHSLQAIFKFSIEQQMSSRCSQCHKKHPWVGRANSNVGPPGAQYPWCDSPPHPRSCAPPTTCHMRDWCGKPIAATAQSQSGSRLVPVLGTDEASGLEGHLPASMRYPVACLGVCWFHASNNTNNINNLGPCMSYVLRSESLIALAAGSWQPGFAITTQHYKVLQVDYFFFFHLE